MKKTPAATEINRLHRSFSEGLRSTVQIAIQIGELLIAQKKKCGHGKWLSWVEANLEFSVDTAGIYMNCFRNRTLSNSESVRNLGVREFAKIAAESIEEIEAAAELVKESRSYRKAELVWDEGQPVKFGGTPLAMMRKTIPTSCPGPESITPKNRIRVQEYLALACRFAQLSGISGDDLLEMLGALLPEFKLLTNNRNNNSNE